MAVKSRNNITLIAEAEFSVRFSETDSLAIVWHGNYFKYFEDGREAFGNKFGLNFLSVYEKEGFVTPLVSTRCEHKAPLKYGEKAIVKTSMVNTPAAKIIFQYEITRISDQKLVATGETVQVFVTPKGQLSFTVPPFYEAWKEKWGINIH